MFEQNSGLLTTNRVAVPLTAVEVYGEIIGRGARVKIIQRFKNSEPTAIEAVYKFPLPADCSVCGFKVTTGDRVLEGEIEERDRAFHIYDKAISEGHGAFLLDEEKPNIFTLSVGNIPAGDSVTLAILYVTMLDVNKDEVRFSLPTTIAPRYVPDYVEDVDGIPVDELVNPPFTQQSTYSLSLSINVYGKEDILAIESPSHKVSNNFNNDSITVSLTSNANVMDRDFVLNVKYKGDFTTRGFVYDDGNDRFIQVDFVNNINEPEATERNYASEEIIFLVDCSGSMQNAPIQAAKRIVKAAILNTLKEEMLFNLYAFGSSYNNAFPLSVPYNRGNKDAALDFVSKIDANLGGTEILPLLQHVFSIPVTPDIRRSIIMLTDGLTGNEEGIFQLIKSNSRKNQLFIVGIGYGSNDYLIKQAASMSGAIATFISPDAADIEAKALGFFSKTQGVCIRDVEITGRVDLDQVPVSPVVYEGGSICIFAKTRDSEILNRDAIHITGTINGKRHGGWTVPLRKVNGNAIPIPVLWAREKIREVEENSLATTGSRQGRRKDGNAVGDELVRLSKKYGLICRETSYVTVEKRLDNNNRGEQIVLRKVPAQLLHGQGSGKVTGKKKMAVDSAIACKAMPSESDNSSYALKRPHSSDAYSISGGYRRSADDIDDWYTPKLGPKPELPVWVLKQALVSSIFKRGKMFKIDPTIAAFFGLYIEEIKRLANKIKTEKTTDTYILLSTQLLIELSLYYQVPVQRSKFDLERDRYLKYPANENLITMTSDLLSSYQLHDGDIIPKVIKWLRAETVRCRPSLEGVTLREWVSEYVKKLKETNK
ncbi:von Willebrand factor A domain-containing protein 5A [Candidatus Magnetobacterium bavaricum]|uniref:von Willebrand factor A domain-containing protein 5A n=1 Tax=Candidatus Magnetobacterium bavaricum TaxID=29290 RepID=A0A0F3GMA9_9BACT|nr:von Willebrand factor A domain-containing protein 5A [Candidatus Magnetobacterium bavaricum]